MNFLDLYKKIRTLDENESVVNEGMSQGNIMPQAISAPPSQPVSECGMEECGMSSEPPKQQDSVSMSVNMNASGVGGIRDLMNVLQNLEKTIDSPEKDIVIGKGSEEPPEIDISALEEPTMPELPSSEPTDMAVLDSDEAVMDEEGDEETTDYANDPEIRKMSVAAIMPTGGDIHSKGKEAPKQAGGGNPWNVSESKIAANLAKHYAEVKSRTDEVYGSSFQDKLQQKWDQAGKRAKEKEHEREWEQEKAGWARKREEAEGPWYLRSDGGKVLKVGGQPKVFDHKTGASRYANKVAEKNPWFKQTLVLTRTPDDVSPEEHKASWQRVHNGHPYPDKERLKTPLGAVEYKLRMSGNFGVFNPGRAAALERNEKEADYSIYISQMHNRSPEFVEDFYQYYDLLSKDPNTDEQTRQVAAADAAALKNAIAHSSEHP